MQAVNGKSGTQIIKVYVCHKHLTEGNAVCPNTLGRPVESVDAAVADSVSANLLREELVVETLQEIRRRLGERSRSSSAEVPELAERAGRLRREIERLAEALAATDEKPHAMVRLIAAREKELAGVEARLSALQAAPSAVDLETRRMEKEARRRLGEFEPYWPGTPPTAGRFWKPSWTARSPAFR